MAQPGGQSNTTAVGDAHPKCIVVAVDGSEASNIAVEWAANAAVKRGQPLKLASAYSMPQFMYADGMVPPQELYDELEGEANDKIDNARAIAQGFSADLQISHEVRESSPIDFLLELSSGAEMIVMGSRGLGGLSGLVMGSVSAAVVSHADCPVVVVRKDTQVTEENKYGPVVVGVDGSTVSRQAMDMAFREAQARKAVLRAVFAWSDMHVHASYAGLAESQEQFDSLVEGYQDLLAEELKPLVDRYPDVEVVEIVERDRPIHALKDAARDAQLLVLGSHGRGGFKGMLLGSTSRALLQYAPCPMMVVRPRD
ncbi:universal stress protein [Corynebacterium heidelbergense]|uniref:Universal stress protein n=1 Tax=Corynebacterium heidelbergense TaxID=2055947 RepID=A0A364V9H9_9CORY|nr:universal stress protein [Corynebacterium heidelbergense]RAV33281.1 universal stress protein [Corynebacterium heidelbergense]WCZ35683.1 Universal stress protein [Corynebacterium heidelbergense]